MVLQWWVTEALVEYGLGCLVILLRIFARTKAVGFKGWQGDDYLILIGFAFFTAEAGLWYGISLATNLDIGPSGPTPKQLEKMRDSYKCNFAVWPAYVTFIWCLKGCILFFYSRLTFGLWQRKLVKIAGWLCIVTYIICMLELFLHCIPLSLNWIVRPYPGSVCGSGLVNYYVVGSLNLITDAVLVCIPLPLMWRVRLPARRKLLLGILLGSGVFIMMATLVRNILGLLSIRHNVGIKNKGFVISWALRENFIALLIVNIPCIYPLFNRHNTTSWLGKPSPNNNRTTTHARSGSYNNNRSSMALAFDGCTGNRSSMITTDRTSADARPIRNSYTNYYYPHSARTPSPDDIDLDSDYELEMPKRAMFTQERRDVEGGNGNVGDNDGLEIYISGVGDICGPHGGDNAQRQRDGHERV